MHRPCWVEVDRQSLRHNWRSLQKCLSPGVRMLAVVKANGYGHGMDTVSDVAVQAGAAALGVSSLEEGMALRQAGFAVPILILGSLYPFDSFPVLFEHRLTPTLASLEAAEALDRLAEARRQKIAVHLKLDSGFGRIGVQAGNALAFIRRVARLKSLIVEGIYTHFASSDIDPGYTRTQARAFGEIVRAAAAEGVRPRDVHMANTSAVIRFPETHGTLVRPGIGLYGIPPFKGAEKSIALSPALTWKSRIIYLKSIASGSSVSYARTWTAGRTSRIATIAAGYADGYPRILSNRAQVLIGGRRVPLVGRVTMDMTMIDVTDVAGCHVGDEVVLLGRQGDDAIRAQEIAEAAQTNAYEIVSRIAPRVPRVNV